MKKLGYTVCATSVKRILLDEGIHPTPEKLQRRQPPMPRGQFVAAHMESLVACDSSQRPSIPGAGDSTGSFSCFCI
jgi:putative transposase